MDLSPRMDFTSANCLQVFSSKAVFVWECQTFVSGMSLSDDDEKLEYSNLLGSSVDLTIRTHLVCCLTSSWVHAPAEFNLDVQIYYWTFGTNKHLWISDEAQIKEKWVTGQSGWGSCPWHMATEGEPHSDPFFILGCKYGIANYMTPSSLLQFISSHPGGVDSFIIPFCYYGLFFWAKVPGCGVFNNSPLRFVNNQWKNEVRFSLKDSF